jgi:hypothetical protein
MSKKLIIMKILMSMSMNLKIANKFQSKDMFSN